MLLTFNGTLITCQQLNIERNELRLSKRMLLYLKVLNYNITKQRLVNEYASVGMQGL